MAIYEITNGELKALEATGFQAEAILERTHLQAYLTKDISILNDDLFVIAEEFSQWQDSHRRIDILCIDSEANLVVVELKRTEDGGYMELQALRYASMISQMTFESLVDVYARCNHRSPDESRQLIMNFLNWDEPKEDLFNQSIRIILCSANFSKELTTSVIWLNQSGLDIQCIRLRPYKTNDGRVMVDVQPIIPLPEASEYQTSLRVKETTEKQQRAVRHEFRQLFWMDLLQYARTKTNLHANRKAGIHGYIGGSAGRSGFNLNYSITEDMARVELYIDCGDEHKNLSALSQLNANRETIEKVFGDALEWEELPDRRACRIRYSIPGGWRSPKAEWPSVHERMVDKMIRLDTAMRTHITALKLS